MTEETTVAGKDTSAAQEPVEALEPAPEALAPAAAPEVSSEAPVAVEPDSVELAFHTLWNEWLNENISGGPIGRDTGTFNALQNAAPALLAKLRGRI